MQDVICRKCGTEICRADITENAGPENFPVLVHFSVIHFQRSRPITDEQIELLERGAVEMAERRRTTHAAGT